MRTRSPPFLLAALALLLLAGCVPISPAGAGTVPAPTPAPAGDGGGDPLDGTAWLLTQVVDASGALTPVPAGVEATATFSDAGMGGSGGCNRYSASYAVDGDSLTLGPAASTMMACMGPGGEVETLFFAALQNVATFVRTESSLTMMDADGNTLLEFVPWVPASLTGTTWLANGINNGREAVVSLVTGTEVSLVFAEDGSFSGQACNNFFGTYTVDGDRITIGPVGSTMMACPEPEGAMEQEQQFFAALERATTWSIEGGRLELRDDNGALQAGFEAAP